MQLSAAITPPLLRALLLLLCLLCLVRFWQGAIAILEGPHINTLNVLLPPKATHPIRYRLQGSGGCFTWSWDHHNVIHLKPEFNGTEGCSKSAVITSIAPYEGRKATAVYAKDTFTGQVIRCEVFIDKPSRIRISHHSLKLDLDGLATLRIHAFDTEDNMFSSLVGIQFAWKLLAPSVTTGTLVHCLAHVPLKNTPLSDCGCVCGDIDTQIELEDQGLGSDLFIVRGINVGQERVSVNVVEPSLDSLEDEILLTVAEAISIEPPSPLYVLVDTRIQYVLKTLRYKHPAVIKLPSPHYGWSIMISSIAEIDPFLGNLSTKSIGSTYVVIQDIRLRGHQQLSALHVVLPSSLKLYFKPISYKDDSQQTISRGEVLLESSDTPWSLVVGWDYVVQVMAFSAHSGSSPIYLTKENALSLFYDEGPYWRSIAVPEDVQKEQDWHNGTLIKAVSEGVGKLSAVLKFKKSILDEYFEVLRVEQEVLVCSPVLILSEKGEPDKVLNLPWNARTIQAYQLKVQGGCGNQPSDYKWFSLDPTIATVNSYGLVHAKGLGYGVVRAMALTNPSNVDEVKVQVSCPFSMVRVEGLPLETEVGSYLPAAVTLRNPEGRYYSKCDSFSSLIGWKVISGESSFIEANDTSDGSSKKNIQDVETFSSVCDLKQFLAVRPGHATITVSLVVENSCAPLGLLPSNKLSVSWTAAAYGPLTILQAGDGSSYGGYHCGTSYIETSENRHLFHQCQISVLRLVPGSSMNVLLKGGPEPWGHGVEFIERHEVSAISGENGMEPPVVTHLAGSGGRLYDIMCGSFGNFTLTFYRGNLFGEEYSAPRIAAVDLFLVCSVPSSITLLVDTESTVQNIKLSAQAHRDRNRVHLSPVTVANGRSLRVAAVALDGNGSPFANASSLPVDWMLVDCLGLAYWEGHPPSEAFIDNGSLEENIILKENSGQCLLRATVRMLHKESWLMSAIHLQNSDFSNQGMLILTDAVQLQLVTSLRVSPNFLLLYNHIHAKGVLMVVGGSSHIEAYSNDSNVAVALDQPLLPQSLQLTVAARGLGAALITVQDVGLISPALDTALVVVAEAAWLHLVMPEEASIQVHSSLEVKLQAGENNGNIFSESQLGFMDIQIHVKDGILELEGCGAENKASGSTFLVRGVNVGVTTIYASVSSRYGQDIVSEQKKVEVYEPLTLHPEGLVLAPGAHYVVWARGGPTIGVSLRFGSSNDTIVSVENPVGLIEANFPGYASIHVQAVMNDGTVVCAATLDVRIQVPLSMHLNVRGGQLALGQKMSLFPTGAQEDLFSFYQLCRSYKWTVGDPQVLSFLMLEDVKDVYEDGPSTSRAGTYSESGTIDTGFSIVAVGRSSGKCDITVEFSCHFQSRRGYSQAKLYTATATIQVIPDPPLALGTAATWLLPPNYRTSNLLLQPTDMTLDGSASGKRIISYSMLQESSKDATRIFLDGTHIKTSERKEVACILARDGRTGRSEIAVCLRIAEVAQILLDDSVSSNRRMEISLGAYHIYSLVLQDDIGKPFHEVGDAAHLIAETNRADVVSVKMLRKEDEDYSHNATVFVQALRQGTAMIRISQIGNPAVAEYFLVDVGAFIFPRSPVLHIGGRVNFSLTGKGLGEHGFWSSSNPNVIQVNKHTGEALALRAGSSSVGFNSSHLTAYTPAKVIEISAISVKAPKDLLTNVGVPEKGYLFPVKFSDPRGQDVGLVATGQRVSYSCRVDPPYLGLCSPWRDPEDEKTYCAFFPHSPERLFLTLQGLGEEAGSRLMVGDSKGCATIKIIVEVIGLPEVGSALATFSGGFQIQDKSSKIRFNPTTNKTKLTVVGSAGGVQVSWTNTDALQVKRISSEREAYGFGGHAVYKIWIVDREQPFSSTIVFHLPTNGQTEEVQVAYNVKEQDNGALLQKMVTAAIVIAVLGLLPFLACARLLDLPRRRHQEHPTTDDDTNGLSPPGRASNGSPMSPVRNLYSSNFESPQSVSLSRSPPQPYTDYISKTIDNTPYFRREGVRRFDPSRTY
ncbi:hypothetical protein GOP47_0029857 [Adiantum capillus-veneris]|nr:hypothetical protein GOP47_0029857 [Adiantum capillus-veneris]